MTTDESSPARSTHPWLAIDLDVYERHMGDPRVRQRQLLHDITGAQLADHPARAVAVLGVAGGNGLDLIDPDTIDAVYGFDVNADYLAACDTRYREVFGDRLHLVVGPIDPSTVIARVDLVIANLIVEYLGVAEFAAFLAINATSIGVLSCVIQRDADRGFVSSSDDSSAFDVLASVSSSIDPEALTAATTAIGFEALGRSEHPLPNGKALVRLDFAGPGGPSTPAVSPR